MLCRAGGLQGRSSEGAVFEKTEAAEFQAKGAVFEKTEATCRGMEDVSTRSLANWRVAWGGCWGAVVGVNVPRQVDDTWKLKLEAVPHLQLDPLGRRDCGGAAAAVSCARGSAERPSPQQSTREEGALVGPPPPPPPPASSLKLCGATMAEAGGAELRPPAPPPPPSDYEVITASMLKSSPCVPHGLWQYLPPPPVSSASSSGVNQQRNCAGGWMQHTHEPAYIEWAGWYLRTRLYAK